MFFALVLCPTNHIQSKRKREKDEPSNSVMEELRPSLIVKKTRNDGPQPLDIKFDAAAFGGQLQNGIKQLHNSELLSDLELLVGEERIRAHKFVLFAYSSRFQELLTNDTSLKELRIESEPEHVPLFKMLLEFIYTGTSCFWFGFVRHLSDI